MDAGKIRIILAAIIENKPDQIEPGQASAALAWIKKRIKGQRNDKGGGDSYNPEMDATYRAMEKAVSLFRQGDAAGAKPFAEEALKQLRECF